MKKLIILLIHLVTLSFHAESQVVDFGETQGFVIPIRDTTNIDNPSPGQMVLMPLTFPIDSTCPPHCGYTMFTFNGETWFDVSKVNGLNLDQWALHDDVENGIQLKHRTSGFTGIQLIPGIEDTLNVVLGGPGNSVFEEGQSRNEKLGLFGPAGATVGGGCFNHALADFSTVSGGELNSTHDNGATVGGGNGNRAFGLSSFVGGGKINMTFADKCTVSGGELNFGRADYSTISGGLSNNASGAFSTIPGGSNNKTGGLMSFAAGNFAIAKHHHTFVWNGKPNTSPIDTFTTTGISQFLIQAPGGVGIGTNSPTNQLTVLGTIEIDGTNNGIKFPDGSEQKTAASSGWNLTGNGGTGGGGILGTTDNFAFSIHTNNLRAYLFIPPIANSDAPSIVGGYQTNEVFAKGGTISGGGSADGHNSVIGSYGTIGGGLDNRVAMQSVVSGGKSNVADGENATISGGSENTASANNSSVSGGVQNAALGLNSVLGGGGQNVASGNGATVPGGQGNRAEGDYSLAAGTRSIARHNNSFVWNDGSGSAIDSLITSKEAQFLVRALGGTNITTDTLCVDGMLKVDMIGNGIVFPDGSVQTTASSGGGNSGWTFTGDAINGGEFLGTTNTEPLVFVVNNKIGMRLLPPLSVTEAPNVIGGDILNVINSGGAFGATISGGTLNSADTMAFVGGGDGNKATGKGSAIAGGIGNIASGVFSTVPGGLNNIAQGENSFAAGSGAEALHDGSFVWQDNSMPGLGFQSTTENQFIVKAAGGTTIFSDQGGFTGVTLTPGSGSWTNASSIHLKTDFEEVGGTDILHQLDELEIRKWRYKSEDSSIRHIGPTSQDFMQSFGLGTSDEGISTVDADGVALAAIKELYQIVKNQAKEIEKLQSIIENKK